jgi:hypothetical protein
MAEQNDLAAALVGQLSSQSVDPVAHFFTLTNEKLSKGVS